MSKKFSLAEHIATLTRPELLAFLRRRPATLLGLAPAGPADLATVWQTSHSMAESMIELPRPGIELLETVAALADGVTTEMLSARLEQTGDNRRHREAVEEVLRSVQDHGLAWRGPKGRVWTSPALEEFIRHPLGLGPAVGSYFRQLRLDEIRDILGAIGLPSAGPRELVERRLLDFYLDPDRIRRVVDAAPDDVRSALLRWAGGHSPMRESFDYHGRPRLSDNIRWSLARGLLVGHDSYDTAMPAPVTMALRGENFRAPFHPVPPDLLTAPAAGVAATAGAALTHFESLAVSVLDVVAAQGLSLLAKGWVGLRELTRVARTVKADSEGVRLALELADAVGLLQHHGGRLSTSDAFPTWRGAEPADRAAQLIAAWWNLGYFPAAHRDADGKDLPALQHGFNGGRYAIVRRHGLQILADLPRHGDPHTVQRVIDANAFAARLVWRQPMVLPAGSVVPPALWRESEILGVIADGALSPVGPPLLADDPVALSRAVGELLPAVATTASFGSDLTVVVAGSASASLGRMMDACADRESRGHASIWRLSPSSVRRAFDAGWNADSLIDSLQDIASAPLPQPLTHLIADIARRHGRVKVAPAGCCLISDDQALLVEICATRALGRLGLRLLAPTVAVSLADAPTTLATLRNAGYLPMPDMGGDEQVIRALGLEALGLSADRPTDVDARQEPPSGPDRVAELLASHDLPPEEVIQQKIAGIAQRILG